MARFILGTPPILMNPLYEHESVARYVLEIGVSGRSSCIPTVDIRK